MFIVDIDGVLLLNPVVVDGDRWNLRCTLADVNYGSPRLLLILFNLIMKVVASDEVEIIMISTILTSTRPFMSNRNLIALNRIVEFSFRFCLTAHLYRSYLSFLILKTGRRIVGEKDYRRRFTSSFWDTLMKSDSLGRLRDSDIDVDINIFAKLPPQLSYNLLNFNDSFSAKVVNYYRPSRVCFSRPRFHIDDIAIVLIFIRKDCLFF